MLCVLVLDLYVVIIRFMLKFYMYNNLFSLHHISIYLYKLSPLLPTHLYFVVTNHPFFLCMHFQIAVTIVFFFFNVRISFNLYVIFKCLIHYSEQVLLYSLLQLAIPFANPLLFTL